MRESGWDTDIYGLALYETSPDLIYGREPNENEVLITDFTAGRIIRYGSQYSDYKDIVEKGIYYNGTKVRVSGIVKTSYSGTDELYENTYDFSFKLFYVYDRFYMPISVYESDSAVSGMQFVYHKNPVTVKAYEGDIGDEEIYVSEDLLSVVSVGSRTLVQCYLYGLVTVVGTVTGEESTIYVSPKILESYKKETLANIEMVDVRNAGVEVVTYLDDHRFEHLTYISAVIDELTDAVEMVRYLFTALVIFSVFILLIFISKVMNEMLEADHRLIVVLRMNGYGWKSVRNIEMKKTLVLYGCTVIGSLPFTVIAVQIIRAVLKSDAGFSVAVALIKPLPVLLVYMCVAVLFAAAFLVMSFRKRRRNLIEFRY